MTASAISSFQPNPDLPATGKLYLVPTPIGNLDDMSVRAVKTLQQVDLVCAEDTRNTQRLLNHFEITTPQISFHEHNTMQRIPQLLERLQAGASLAQVSDAGMPCISDPGVQLVEACVAHQIPVVALPGPNAGLTALIASGIAPQPFTFIGFLERKKQRQIKQLSTLSTKQATMIFYESPHRLAATLENMATVFGEQRPAVLCRELTKKYEQYVRGSLQDLVTWSTTQPVKGEFVILVSGASEAEVKQAAQTSVAQVPLEEAVDALIAAGKKPNQAIKAVAKARNLSRQVVYQQYHHLED